MQMALAVRGVTCRVHDCRAACASYGAGCRAANSWFGSCNIFTGKGKGQPTDCPAGWISFPPGSTPTPNHNLYTGKSYKQPGHLYYKPPHAYCDIKQDGLELAFEALAKAKMSVTEAQKAHQRSNAAARDANTSWDKQAKDHNLLVGAQLKAEGAQRLARSAGKGSRNALKNASHATDLAAKSLQQAKNADTHAEKLEHVTAVQKHTLDALGKCQVALNKTMDTVRHMQVVDEALLNTTKRTTSHLGKVLDTQNTTLLTIQHMQHVDNHTVTGLNHTIASLNYTLSHVAERQTASEDKLKETEKALSETTGRLEHEQKVLKATGLTTLSVVLVYTAQQLVNFVQKKAAGAAFSKARADVYDPDSPRLGRHRAVRSRGHPRRYSSWRDRRQDAAAARQAKVGLCSVEHVAVPGDARARAGRGRRLRALGPLRGRGHAGRD